MIVRYPGALLFSASLQNRSIASVIFCDTDFVCVLYSSLSLISPPISPLYVCWGDTFTNRFPPFPFPLVRILHKTHTQVIYGLEFSLASEEELANSD